MRVSGESSRKRARTSAGAAGTPARTGGGRPRASAGAAGAPARAGAGRPRAPARRPGARPRTRARSPRAQPRAAGRDGKWVVVDGERTVADLHASATPAACTSTTSPATFAVNGSTGGEIQVETIKHARGSNESEARQQLADVDSSYQKVGNRVEIETTHTAEQPRLGRLHHQRADRDERGAAHGLGRHSGQQREG